MVIFMVFVIYEINGNAIFLQKTPVPPPPLFRFLESSFIPGPINPPSEDIVIPLSLTFRFPYLRPL